MFFFTLAAVSSPRKSLVSDSNNVCSEGIFRAACVILAKYLLAVFAFVISSCKASCSICLQLEKKILLIVEHHVQRVPRVSMEAFHKSLEWHVIVHK